MADSKCLNATPVAFSRAAIKAASLQTLATSAPENPGVLAASFLETSFLSTIVLMGAK